VRLIPRALLRELRLIPRRKPAPGERAQDDPEVVVSEAPPAQNVWLLPGIDVAGEYYIAKKNPKQLEDEVRRRIPQSLRGIPPVYRQTGVLLALLGRREQLRGEKRARQLIVSTNYDILLECALVLAGVPFTRVVQYRTGKQLQIDRYPGPAADEARSALTPAQFRAQVLQAFESVDEPPKGPGEWLSRVLERPPADRSADAAGGTDFAEDAGVLLYKLAGSVDVGGSCAISTDQLLNLVVEQQRSGFIPAQFQESVAETSVLFLGFWPLDPDLRLAFQLFREQLVAAKERERILVPYWPRGREATMRMGLKEKAASRLGGMRVVDEHADRFLERLVKRTLEIL
jgi:hypothetical protein